MSAEVGSSDVIFGAAGSISTSSPSDASRSSPSVMSSTTAPCMLGIVRTSMFEAFNEAMQCPDVVGVLGAALQVRLDAEIFAIALFRLFIIFHRLLTKRQIKEYLRC